MRIYLDLLSDVLHNGAECADRTGVGTLSVFGRQVRYNLSAGFPLVTTKRLHVRSIIIELLWFLRGETNISYLRDNGVSIWDEWADVSGELGPIYGKQWRAWESADGAVIDQVRNLIDSIKTDPYSRRHIISAWNVGEIESMALPACHCLFQFHVSSEGYLSCHLYQRSADIFLGVPFNIASYALLTMMVAQVCGLKAGDFIHSFGDLHLYRNHIEQAERQLLREPYDLPIMRLNERVDNIFSFSFADFELVDYRCHEKISAPIAV